MKEQKYETLEIDMALTETGVYYALSKLEYNFATLYVTVEDVGRGCDIARNYKILNLAVDPDLEPDEWYLEYSGRKVGCNP